MDRPYRKIITVSEVNFNFSSAYDKDYLTVQEGVNCIAVDITDNRLKDELINMLQKSKGAIK